MLNNSVFTSSDFVLLSWLNEIRMIYNSIVYDYALLPHSIFDKIECERRGLQS